MLDNRCNLRISQPQRSLELCENEETPIFGNTKRNLNKFDLPKKLINFSDENENNNYILNVDAIKDNTNFEILKFKDEFHSKEIDRNLRLDNNKKNTFEEKAIFKKRNLEKINEETIPRYSESEDDLEYNILKENTFNLNENEKEIYKFEVEKTNDILILPSVKKIEEENVPDRKILNSEIDSELQYENNSNNKKKIIVELIDKNKDEMDIELPYEIPKANNIIYRKFPEEENEDIDIELYKLKKTGSSKTFNNEKLRSLKNIFDSNNVIENKNNLEIFDSISEKVSNKNNFKIDLTYENEIPKSESKNMGYQSNSYKYDNNQIKNYEYDDIKESSDDILNKSFIDDDEEEYLEDKTIEENLKNVNTISVENKQRNEYQQILRASELENESNDCSFILNNKEINKGNIQKKLDLEVEPINHLINEKNDDKKEVIDLCDSFGDYIEKTENVKYFNQELKKDAYSDNEDNKYQVIKDKKDEEESLFSNYEMDALENQNYQKDKKKFEENERNDKFSKDYNYNNTQFIYDSNFLIKKMDKQSYDYQKDFDEEKINNLNYKDFINEQIYDHNNQYYRTREDIDEEIKDINNEENSHIRNQLYNSDQKDVYNDKINYINTIINNKNSSDKDYKIMNSNEFNENNNQSDGIVQYPTFSDYDNKQQFEIIQYPKLSDENKQNISETNDIKYSFKNYYTYGNKFLSLNKNHSSKVPFDNKNKNPFKNDFDLLENKYNERILKIESTYENIYNYNNERQNDINLNINNFIINNRNFQHIENGINPLEKFDKFLKINSKQFINKRNARKKNLHLFSNRNLHEVKPYSEKKNNFQNEEFYIRNKLRRPDKEKENEKYILNDLENTLLDSVIIAILKQNNIDENFIKEKNVFTSNYKIFILFIKEIFL